MPRSPLIRRSCLATLLLGILLGCSPAAEIPDPWSDLRPANAVRCLVALRAALDAQPDDQRLLGSAISAYVVLCLSGQPESDGAFGPWLEYARTLVDRRRAARGGAATTAIDDAAPELWVRLIDGDAVGVVAELDRLPATVASQQGVVLRALATSDWRPLAQFHPRSALTDYAGMTLFHLTKASMVGRNPAALGLIDPYIVHRSRWELTNDPRDVAVLPGEAVAGIALLLRASQIDDATAITEAGKLLIALGAAVDPAASRDQVIATLHRSAQAMPAEQIQAFAVAERIALAHCDGEQGIRCADGHHLLVGVGDVAQWVRSRLYDAAFFGYLSVWHRLSGYPDEKMFLERDQAFGAPLRKELPDALLAADISVGLTDPEFTNMDEPSPKAAAEALANAIRAERARAHPLPDRQLIRSLAKLAKRRPDLATPIVADVLTHWQMMDGTPARTGFKGLLRAAWICDAEVDLPAMARSSAQRNPADATLQGYTLLLDPQERMLTWDGLTPTTTWIAANIDAHKRQFPQLKHGDGEFVISWEGWLQIEQPGTYQFQLISDGFCKTAIGECVLADPRSTVLFPGLVAHTTGHSRNWQPGWQPLWMDYRHSGGDVDCRLLWKPPGATAYAPIPERVLVHGTEQVPGLATMALEARQAPTAFPQVTGVSASAFAWAGTLPWNAAVQLGIGASATVSRQFAQVLPLLRAGTAAGVPIDPSYTITCLLMQRGTDLDEGFALLRTHEFRLNGFAEQRALISHLRDEQRLTDFATSQRAYLKKSEQRFLRMVINLCIGGLVLAQPDLADGLGDASLWIVKTELRPLCLLAYAAHRMCGKPPPDFKRLNEQAGEPKDAGYLAALDALNGVHDPQTFAGLSPWDQDLVRWASALLDLSEGEHQRARDHFVTLTNNPQADPSIAELGRDLLAWYATQTPATLATTPKAPPVKRRTVAAIKPGADDF